MSVHGDIRAALRARLHTAIADDAVAFEGRLYNSGVGVVYYRETFKPNVSDLQTLGPTGRIRHEGLYLLDVFSPAGKGVTEVESLVGALMDLFPPNLNLTQNGRVVIVRKAYRSGIQTQQGGYLMVPVTISWYCDTFNSL